MNEPADRHRKLARAKTGVWLPNTDPTIGEIVLAALFANENATIPAIAAALLRDCPKEIVAEVSDALFEVVFCHDRGELFWLETSAQAILVGARKSVLTDSMIIGHAMWPMCCLLVGPPHSVTIRVPNGARQVWMACEPLDGVIVRQSEAVALGNAMIEAFGGRIIEDRQGPDVMQQSFIEANMSKRSKARAEAASAVERFFIEPRMRAALRPGHAVVPAMEAGPGSLEPGVTLHPEDQPGAVYEVMRRINGSWVILVAAKPGKGAIVGGGAWMRCDEGGTFPDGPFGVEPHWAFTEGASMIPGVPTLNVPGGEDAKKAAEE